MGSPSIKYSYIHIIFCIQILLINHTVTFYLIFFQDYHQFETEAIARMKSFEAQLYKSYQHGVTDSGTKVWSFWNSMFFCGTIYTTIGKVHNHTSTFFLNSTRSPFISLYFLSVVKHRIFIASRGHKNKHHLRSATILNEYLR